MTALEIAHQRCALYWTWLYAERRQTTQEPDAAAKRARGDWIDGLTDAQVAEELPHE